MKQTLLYVGVLAVGLGIGAWYGIRETREDWRRAVETAPVVVDSSTAETPATAEPVRRTVVPKTATPDSVWQARMDSLRRSIGDSVHRLYAALEEAASPMETTEPDTLRVNPEDPEIGFDIPFVLRFRSERLPGLHIYELLPLPFEAKYRVIEKEYLVPVPQRRSWLEQWLPVILGLLAIIGFST